MGEREREKGVNMFPGRGKDTLHPRSHYNDRDVFRKDGADFLPKSWREIPFVPSEASTKLSPPPKRRSGLPLKRLLLTMSFWMEQHGQKWKMFDGPANTVGCTVKVKYPPRSPLLPDRRR
ncbi:hypothetical protein CEXT_512881 [Caerostris extrusa]|uniref:Uncharacterized protein n=1 Tax=Caerostris extrusa TaxID=172846 RepID=A0AAV4XGA5_CAEEX|nr:hypothetical protein CEXT_512881 [Caerostris extrusa]